MQGAASRRNAARMATWCVIAAAAVIAVRNATVYPAIAGYDAPEAIDYATFLVQDGRLPRGTGSYYTPPGFFAVGGVGIELGNRLGLEHPERIGQLANAARSGRHGAVAPRARPAPLARTRGAAPHGDRVFRRLPRGDEVGRDVPSRATVDAALDGCAGARRPPPRSVRLPAPHRTVARRDAGARAARPRLDPLDGGRRDGRPRGGGGHATARSSAARHRARGRRARRCPRSRPLVRPPAKPLRQRRLRSAPSRRASLVASTARVSSSARASRRS